MTTSIVQVVPSLAARDAIGGHVLEIDDALRAAGVDTAIYAGHIEPHLAERARLHTELVSPAHATRSIPAVPLVDRLARR